MRRIVAGIIAVFCLQASFQAYLAVEQSREEYRTWSRTSDLNDPLGDFELDTAAVDESTPDASTVPVAVRHTINRATEAPVLATYRRPVFKRVPQTVEATNFKTVTITYRAPVRYETASYVQTPAAPIKDIRKPEKRSFASKAWAVTKKPYDWLKAFAVKFKG